MVLSSSSGRRCFGFATESEGLSVVEEDRARLARLEPAKIVLACCSRAVVLEVPGPKANGPAHVHREEHACTKLVSVHRCFLGPARRMPTTGRLVQPCCSYSAFSLAQVRERVRWPFLPYAIAFVPVAWGMQSRKRQALCFRCTLEASSVRSRVTSDSSVRCRPASHTLSFCCEMTTLCS